jgi:glycerol kinase
VNDLLLAMQEDAGKLTELRVDGGATRSNLLMQFQADLLRVPLVLPLESESTALGAAFLAGLAVSFWKDLQELSSLWKEKKRFTPQMDEKTAKKLIQEWQLAVRATQMGSI